jgi:hypothetical protein
VADWLVDRPSDARAFPTVRHRHPNGTLDAVRHHTPTVVQQLGQGTPMERWSYMCPCGEVWAFERRRQV